MPIVGVHQQLRKHKSVHIDDINHFEQPPIAKNQGNSGHE